MGLLSSFPLVSISPCHKRGVLMEIPAIVLFSYSCIVVSGALESYWYTVDYMDALYQSPIPKLIETSNVWWFFRWGIVAIVIILFLRLYSSFSVFDHDQKECTDWIHPLTRLGRFLEAAIRLGVVAYLIFQVHHGIKEQIHPVLIDMTDWFTSLSSHENLESIMSQRLKGPINESSVANSDRDLVANAASEMRSLSLNIAVLVELMLIALLWDLSLLIGRIRPATFFVDLGTSVGRVFQRTRQAVAVGGQMEGENASLVEVGGEVPTDLGSFPEIRAFPYRAWMVRFLMPHLSVGLFMFAMLFILSLLSVGDDTPLQVGLLAITLCFVALVLFSFSIIVSWLLFVFRKLLGYARVHCPGLSIP